MRISSLNFEYLRPTEEVLSVYHEPEYIKSTFGKKTKRRIFHHVSFDSNELKMIQDFERGLKDQKFTLPNGWNPNETLKYLYAANFDFQEATLMIKNCLKWRMDPESYTLTNEILDLLKSGVIYIFGSDKQYRPILVVNLNKIDFSKANVRHFQSTLSMCMDIMRSYCFVPGKIENWIVILDAQNTGNINDDKIKPVLYLLKCCFPASLERLFLLSTPQLLEKHWDLASGMDKDSLEEIQLVSNTDLSKLQQYIPPKSLEKKYGGDCPNLIEFWPPQQPGTHTGRKETDLNESLNSRNFIDGPKQNSISDLTAQPFKISEHLLNATTDSIFDFDNSVRSLFDDHDLMKNIETPYEAKNKSHFVKPAIPERFQNMPAYSDQKSLVNPILPSGNRELLDASDNDWRSDVVHLDNSLLSETRYRHHNLNFGNPQVREETKLQATPQKGKHPYNNSDPQKYYPSPQTSNDSERKYQDNQSDGDFRTTRATFLDNQNDSTKKRVSFGVEVLEESNAANKLPTPKSNLKSSGKFKGDESIQKRLLEMGNESGNEEEDDADGLFCGLCFTRKKNKTGKAV